MVADDLATVGGEVSDEGVGDRLGAAGGERPADEVPDGADGDAERRRQGAVERQDGVGGQPGEERGAGLRPQSGAGDARCRADGGETEASQGDRVPGDRQRRQQVVDERRSDRRERRHEAAPRRTVGAEPVGRDVDGPVQHGRVAGQRVGEGHIRVDPPQPVGLERQGAQRRGGDGEGVDRRSRRRGGSPVRSARPCDIRPPVSPPPPGRARAGRREPASSRRPARWDRRRRRSRRAHRRRASRHCNRGAAAEHRGGTVMARWSSGGDSLRSCVACAAVDGVRR